MFTIPHFRADPHSYSVPTPSAIKGCLRSCYWKPEFEWEVDEIHVLRPIRFVTMKVHALPAPTLQTITLLADVAYGVVARMVLNPFRTGGVTRSGIQGYAAEALRRMQKGEHFRQPCFGRLRYPADWELVRDIPSAQPVDMDLGPLLFDQAPIDIDRDLWEPIFFPAELKQGVLYVPRKLHEEHRLRLMRARNTVHPIKKGRGEVSP
jgi:CRISPR-associated protein Cas5d